MSSSAWDVVGIGESSVDEVYRLPGAPGPNVKLPISSRADPVRRPGRDGAGDVRLVRAPSHAGRNGWRRRTRRWTARGARAPRRGHLAPDSPLRPPSPCLVLVNEQTGDRVVLWERDPRLSLDAADLPRAVIESARLSTWTPLTRRPRSPRPASPASAGIPVTSDIDRMTDRTEALVAAVTVPIFAEHIPHALTGEADHERALRKLRTTHQRHAVCDARPTRLDAARRHSTVPGPRARRSRR